MAARERRAAQCVVVRVPWCWAHRLAHRARLSAPQTCCASSGSPRLQSRSLVTVPRSLVLAALPLVLVCLGCNRDAPDETSSAAVEPGPKPSEPETPPTPELVAEPEPEAPPELEPVPEPPLEPQSDERKQALANVGRAAFDALRAGDFEALLALTPMVDPYLRDACPSLPAGSRDELEARFRHCQRSIDWDAVAEAQVFAGKPTGAPASGCETGIEDYGRLQLYAIMNDKKIWRVEFFGAVGQDGNAIGINGEVSCKQVDEVPPLN